jgi:hypothetical protein
LDGYRAVRLFGQFPGFDVNLSVTQLGCDFLCHKDSIFLRRHRETSVNTCGQVLIEIAQGQRIFCTRYRCCVKTGARRVFRLG